MQATLKVTLELQGYGFICGGGEHAAVAAGMDSFGPAPVARNGSTAGIQPDLSMRGQGDRRLGFFVQPRHRLQPPGAAAVPILKQQIDMASTGVVRRSGVT